MIARERANAAIRRRNGAGQQLLGRTAKQHYLLLPNQKFGSNMRHVLRLPPFAAASKTA